MSCSFVWGAIFVKYDILDKIKKTVNFRKKYTNALLFLLLLLSIVIRALIPIHAASILFMVFIVCWFTLIDKSKAFGNVLMKLGRHSTNIWLVHTFFCYYLFHDFIYSLQYPIVIIIVVLGLSLISSVILEKIYQIISNKLLYIKV